MSRSSGASATYLQAHHWSDTKKPGLKLIVQKVSMLDARQREASLTPKGRKLVQQIDEIING